jgi:Phosphate-selective porin O and P
MNTLSVKKASHCVLAFLIMLCFSANAQEKKEEPKPEKKWYDIMSIRGYAQVRYNRLLETNENLKCEQCDRSIGKNGGFFIRRMRLIFFGNITSRVYYYFQPDLASSASTNGLHFAQIRDAYFDVGIDEKNEFRFRIGQSKVPYGFENMQSSQNRLTLDRNDALNSAVSNERDLGLFFYYAPEAKRKLFSKLVKDGLKGSGDYGIFAFGAYNGQTANRPEGNSKPHIVGRITYPLEVKNQIVEASVQAYTGKWTMATDQTSTNTKINLDRTYDDQRFAASLILYPQPFGIQCEYNIGTGPQFNPNTDAIEQKKLKGGYFLANYKTQISNKTVITFARYQFYKGGKKHELDARSYDIKELEFGTEWQFSKGFELTASYCVSNRRFEDFVLQDNLQKGNFLRLQAQVNF